ncbi:YveK family protein [Marinilactibacillus sp. GCM10026970]|uniref:YveK family protein n=1 Tax=Marinilactibacillus sp. GCM10026970 TaxID=3252642 RepID=UPI00361A0281
MEEEISLVEIFNMLKKHIVLIINSLLVGVIITALYTFFIATPQFSSTTRMLVSRSQTEELIQRSDIETNVQLINTYSDIIRDSVILEDVKEELGIDSSLQGRINVSTENNSQVFSIAVTDDNPYSAADIANTTASVFQEKLPTLMNVDNVSIISEATANTSPVSPNTTLNLAIGIILGGMIGVAVSFLIEFLDNTVKDTKFLVEEIGWTNLGRVSEMTPDELSSDGRLVKNNKTIEPDSRSARTRV